MFFFYLHLPDLCLLFILGHFFTVGEVKLLDVLVPALSDYFFWANIYSYELCLHACKYDFFLSNDMIGLLAVHFGVG